MAAPIAGAINFVCATFPHEDFPQLRACTLQQRRQSVKFVEQQVDLLETVVQEVGGYFEGVVAAHEYRVARAFGDGGLSALVISFSSCSTISAFSASERPSGLMKFSV